MRDDNEYETFVSTEWLMNMLNWKRSAYAILKGEGYCPTCLQYKAQLDPDMAMCVECKAEYEEQTGIYTTTTSDRMEAEE